MKYLAAILFTVILFACKKNKNNPQQQDDPKISPGHYIIRTKYLCADGKAFVLGSFSNHETMNWQQATPEEVKAIKEDGPYDSNNLIWTVGESISHGGTVLGLPAPSFAGNVRHVFSIYQEDLTDPDNPIRWYIVTPDESISVEDHTGLGIGPSIRTVQGSFTEEDLGTTTISMTYSWMTDSTGRLSAYAQPYWWYVSLPTDPDDVCDDFNNTVIWRNSWLCPNSTTIGSAWKVEACHITQLVMEKVD